MAFPFALIKVFMYPILHQPFMIDSRFLLIQLLTDNFFFLSKLRSSNMFLIFFKDFLFWFDLEKNTNSPVKRTTTVAILMYRKKLCRLNSDMQYLTTHLYSSKSPHHPTHGTRCYARTARGRAFQKIDVCTSYRPVFVQWKAHSLLTVLCFLVPSYLQSSRHSKLEKADILEMTVKYLRNMQRQHMSGENSIQTEIFKREKSTLNRCKTKR